MSENFGLAEIFQRSVSQVKGNIPQYLVFLFFFLVLDISNYYLQTQVFYTEEASRMVEICFQLLLVLYTVIFYHSLNLKRLNLDHSMGQLLVEGLFLSPGFVLQTLFLILATLVGGVLLIIPGIYAFFVFYYAPVFSVLYPDYEGKLFFHTREICRERLGLTISMILITGILPFLPDGFIFLLTGSMKNILMAVASPVDGTFYLFFQTMIFEYVFELVHRDRLSQA